MDGEVDGGIGCCVACLVGQLRGESFVNCRAVQSRRCDGVEHRKVDVGRQTSGPRKLPMRIIQVHPSTLERVWRVLVQARKRCARGLEVGKPDPNPVPGTPFPLDGRTRFSCPLQHSFSSVVRIRGSQTLTDCVGVSSIFRDSHLLSRAIHRSSAEHRGVKLCHNVRLFRDVSPPCPPKAPD